jgi:hypothetical protein
MTDHIDYFPINHVSFSTQLMQQPYPFCEVNLTSGWIKRFLPGHPEYSTFLTLLAQLHIPLEIVKSSDHLAILYEVPRKSAAEIRDAIAFNTFTNDELAELRGYRIDPSTGDFHFATDSQVYQDYRETFTQVGLDIDLMTSVYELEDNALRLHTQYKAVVSKRLLRHPHLSEWEKFQLGVFAADTDRLVQLHDALTRADNDNDED